MENFHSNDNFKSRGMLFNNDGLKDGGHETIAHDKIRFLPISTYLLKQYRPDVYGRGFEDQGYLHLESSICFWLTWNDNCQLERNFKFDRIADYLQINRLLLFNDEIFLQMIKEIS